MLYKIEWDTDNIPTSDLDLPTYVWVDSLPILDNNNNIYPDPPVFHINPNEYSHINNWDNAVADILTDVFDWLVTSLTPDSMENLPR